MSIQVGNPIPLGQNAYWMTTAPPGITINQALTANGDVNAGGWTTGVVVGDFWQNVTTGAWGGSTLAQGQNWFNTGLEGSPNINSQIYGIQIVCTRTPNVPWGYCFDSTPPWFTVSGITLEGTENTAPSVTGQGTLWATGSYVWNPPGDDFPVTLYSSDVSGICSSWVALPSGTSERPFGAAGRLGLAAVSEPGELVVQRRHAVAGAYRRKFQIDLSATNAAGMVDTATESVSVDNDPVGVSFRTPNDPNPSVWVNHAVTVDATPSAGPSGVGGMNCSIDDASAKSYPASGLSVNGDGIHTVSCIAWNQAVGPQGQPNTGTNSMTVHDRRVAAIVELPAAEPGRSDGAGGGHERQRIWCRGRLDRDGPGRHQRLDVPSDEL